MARLAAVAGGAAVVGGAVVSGHWEANGHHAPRDGTRPGPGGGGLPLPFRSASTTAQTPQGSPPPLLLLIIPPPPHTYDARAARIYTAWCLRQAAAPSQQPRSAPRESSVRVGLGFRPGLLTLQTLN